MSYPRHAIRIDSRAVLEALIVQLKEAVAEGALQQYTPSDAPFALNEMEPAGPWPDYLEAWFRDPTSGRRYRLVAETFHGSGGRWEQVGNEG